MGARPADRDGRPLRRSDDAQWLRDHHTILSTGNEGADRRLPSRGWVAPRYWRGRTAVLLCSWVPRVRAVAAVRCREQRENSLLTKLLTNWVAQPGTEQNATDWRTRKILTEQCYLGQVDTGRDGFGRIRQPPARPVCCPAAAGLPLQARPAFRRRPAVTEFRRRVRDNARARRFPRRSAIPVKRGAGRSAQA